MKLPPSINEAQPILLDLIERYCNGQLDEAGHRKLQAILQVNPQARKIYRRYMNLHAALHERADQEDGDLLGAKEELDLEEPRTGRWIVAVCIAFLVGAALALLLVDKKERQPDLVDQETSGERLETVEPARRGAATIGSQIGAVWMGQGGDFFPGGALERGRCTLISGVARIDFYSGVSLTLESPVSLELRSPDDVEIIGGKSYLTVPGKVDDFILRVGDSVVSGSGFECGVSAGESHQMRVFRGELTLSRGEQRILLDRGLLYKDGEVLNVEEKDQVGYLSARELNALESVQQSRKYEQWKLFRNSLRAHPDLVTYYDFELDDENERELNDESSFDRNGVVVGCEWVEGRWPDKNALEFKNTSDRVRMTIPGIFDELTMVVWIRIDGLNNAFNPILLTDEFEDGEVHWQIRSSGQLDVGIRHPDHGEIFVTDRVLSAEVMGRWHQLAITYSKDRGTPRHYLNGRLLAKEAGVAAPEGPSPLLSKPLRIGRAELGNWSPARAYDRWPARNFNGRIDEFAVFSRELTEGELLEFYESGNPDL